MHIKVEERRSVHQLRTETRMKVMLSGELLGKQGACACRLHDISRGGACLDADRPHAPGDAVTLVRGSFRATGKVSWARGRRLGISFDQPIRATELLVQMSHSRHAQTAAPAPALTASAIPLSPSR